MTRRDFFILLSTSLAFASAADAVSPPRVVGASGAWATVAGPAGCEAVSAALQPAPTGKVQARAALAFDAAPGGRRGQFAIHLSRVPRAGSSVMLSIGDTPFLLTLRGDWAWSRGPAQEAAIIAALRGASGMRIEARFPGGGRFIDRFDLNGAPTAIDAAAACALSLAKSGAFH